MKEIRLYATDKILFQPLEFEFHIAKEVRKKYDLDASLFSTNGNVIFANFSEVRNFVFKLNSQRDNQSKIAVSEVNFAGLLDEIFHFVFRKYEEEINPKVFSKAVDYLNYNLGEEKVRKLIFNFTELFPPAEVYAGKSSVFDYLNSYSGSRSNYEIALEELLLLNISNFNPANEKLKELFDENLFEDISLYNQIIDYLDTFFKNELPIGAENQDLITFIKTPILLNKSSLSAQLDYILEKWEIVLKDNFKNRILTGKDLLKEDYYPFDTESGFSDTPTIVPVYQGGLSQSDEFALGKSGYKYAEKSVEEYAEYEQFTPDIHWMPNVKLMAKNVYVWLDQLSKKYKREIKRLDQIPEEELDQIANWSFNGLWLIGLWERSSASKKIKHILGNIDAVASAYSLFDYQIAHDLGGSDAYDIFNQRAKARGIRLASDMVPNHTGIFSKWVIEHPEFYIQADNPPFPNYRFTGEDLSESPEVQLRIEDGYWNKSDAAVVFQRIDNRTGEVKYIYHGNDGTNMPWNDTAQLNLLKHEVRQAVIDKIFEVAQKFSIIRFDAAMTLTKKHFSRLWFPQPGLGGDIPSRVDHSMTRDQFDEFFPVEFWREVVDKINNEMPNTLLLAEAFWLMEGYFVRTLGMHRVYNSAFMHMMMKEENEKYRDLITNTLEFEPEILKRYVNFMSNPDEETAIQQFGTEDKYFGVLTLMVTLPGLPMFAHGQVEGFTEKYGMEYKRAYYNEEPKEWLVERHKREIFPLMKIRRLFSEVDNFWLYDCFDQFGNINENVFAFTNSFENQKALVLYNNKYDSTEIWFKESTGKLISAYGEKKVLKSVRFSDLIEIKSDSTYFYSAKNLITNKEHLFNGEEIYKNGFNYSLSGFEYLVFVEFNEMVDYNGDIQALYNTINGNPVENVKKAVAELKVKPLQEAFELIFDEPEFNSLIKYLTGSKTNADKLEDSAKFIVNKFKLFLHKVNLYFDLNLNEESITEDYSQSLEYIKLTNDRIREYENSKSGSRKFTPAFYNFFGGHNYSENILLEVIVRTLNFFKSGTENTSAAETLHEKLMLDSSLTKILTRLGKGEKGVFKELTLLKILLRHSELLSIEDVQHLIGYSQNLNSIEKYFIEYERQRLSELLNDDYVRAFLLVNLHEDVWYFSKERFEELIEWYLTIAFVKFMNHDFTLKKKESKNAPKEIQFHLGEILKAFAALHTVLLNSSGESNYKLEKLAEKFKIELKQLI
ncbi:MAG: alpha-amylase family glycosyl hydrolase [Bacteroidota bacterium]